MSRPRVDSWEFLEWVLSEVCLGFDCVGIGNFFACHRTTGAQDAYFKIFEARAKRAGLHNSDRIDTEKIDYIEALIYYARARGRLLKVAERDLVRRCVDKVLFQALTGEVYGRGEPKKKINTEPGAINEVEGIVIPVVSLDDSEPAINYDRLRRKIIELKERIDRIEEDMHI